MDVLSEVISTLELSSRLWFRAELSAPYAVAVPEANGAERGAIRFHVIREGACTLTVGSAESVRFSVGDLVLVPHGAAHVLSDAPERTPVPLVRVLAEAHFDGVGPLVAGGGGKPCALVCGEFTFGSATSHPFLSSLPSWLHVPAGEGASFGWIERVLEHIESESRTSRVGHTEVIKRLSEIVLIEVLRSRASEAGLGALSALGDAQLARSLEAIHARPETNWTLETLARAAGQSRTLFAERFRAEVGVTPMKYLAMWRMQKASGLLTEGRDTVAEVARRVGYASESAFTRAFKARFGASPGAYRRSLAPS